LKAGKGLRPTRSTAGNFFKRRVGKTYHFWTETYLVWKAGGGGEVARALMKKIDPR